MLCYHTNLITYPTIDGNALKGGSSQAFKDACAVLTEILLHSHFFTGP